MEKTLTLADALKVSEISQLVAEVEAILAQANHEAMNGRHLALADFNDLDAAYCAVVGEV